MATILEQVVLLNNDPPASRLCFVCGFLIKDKEQMIVDTKTNYTSVPLPNKLSDLVGHDFCIVVSKFDEICDECLMIVNEVDELEYNLDCAKRKILCLLESKYDINFSASGESNCVVFDEDDDDKFYKDGERVVVQLNESAEISLDEVEESPSDEPQVELCLDIPEECESPDAKCEERPPNSFSEVEGNDKSADFKYEPLSQMKDTTCLDTVSLYNLETNNIKEQIDSNLCEYCCSSFCSVDELSEHINKCHSAKTIDTIFDEGPEVFIDNSSPGDSEAKISNIIFKCGVCNFSDANKDTVTEHLQTVHKVVCEICSATFEKASELLVHYMSHGESEVICICKICEMPFPNKARLARHSLVHKKSNGPITCQVCGKICNDNVHAMHHRRNEHSIIQDLHCGLCNIPVESSVELKHHLLMIHRGKNEYKCKECDKTFSRHLQYENHRTYAHGNSQCRICGKHIENLVKLKQHEHRHARADTKKLECDVCHKIFKTQGGLKVHSVSHTGKYKFFCEFCGRGFMSAVILEEHKGVHTKEERYVCDICGRKFVLYSTFHLHRQWHKDPYPFPCKMCSRKFRYRSERSNHIRRDHTGETPYKCDHCFAAFIKLGYLKKHLIIHTKVYPHICSICDKGYYQKRALARHCAKVHNDPTLLHSLSKACQYKVALRPEEYPEVDGN